MTRLQSHHLVILALGLLAVGSLFRLGLVELRGEEPRRAVVALEMLDSGEFVVPQVAGHTYYNKPPLFNWMVAASMALFGGADAWMVRLPSVLAWWLTGLLTFLVTDRFVDRVTATWATLFTLTCGELLFYGSVLSGELDLFFALIVAAQAAAIFWFLRGQQWTRMFVVSWALAAAGFLTKGMPAVAFQVLTVGVACIGFGYRRRLADPRQLAGLATFGLLVGAYLLAYSSRQPLGPFLVSLFEEASQRTGLGSPVPDVLNGALRFPLVILQLLLPWSLLAVWLGDREVWPRMWANPWVKFCLLFCAANLPLYWLSGELRHRYVYPFFPFLLVPLAFAFSRRSPDRAGLRRWTGRAAAAVLGLLVVGALVVPWVDPFRRFPGVLAAGIAWALAGSVVLAVHLRRPDLRVPAFALALVLARLAFDVAYLPAMNLSRVSAYPPHVAAMIREADGAPVVLGGPGVEVVREASIGPLQLGEVHYEIPPSVAHQVLWHYARLAGRPMQWKREPRAGEYVLIDRARLGPDGPDPLVAFHDHWTGADLALVRWR